MSPTVKTKASTKNHKRAVHHAQTNPDLDLVSYDTMYCYLIAMLTCYNQTHRANDAASKQILEGHAYTKKTFKVGVDVPPNTFSELFSLYAQFPTYRNIQNLKITIAIYLAILALDGLPTSLMIGCTCGVDPALMGDIPCMDFVSREVIEAVKTRDVHNAFGIRQHDEFDANTHAEIMKAIEENQKRSVEAHLAARDASHDAHEKVPAPVSPPKPTYTAPPAPEMTEVYYGSGTWTTISFFNHACIENVTRRREGRAWVFEACVSDPAYPEHPANSANSANSTNQTPCIPAGTDLCISYIRHLTHAPLYRRRATLRAWGFECHCALCVAQEEEERREREKILGGGEKGGNTPERGHERSGDEKK
jgi:hypothetical protein